MKKTKGKTQLKFRRHIVMSIAERAAYKARFDSMERQMLDFTTNVAMAARAVTDAIYEARKHRK